MAEGERRSGAKLHKQPEVEDDDGEDLQQDTSAAPPPSQALSDAGACGSKEEVRSGGNASASVSTKTTGHRPSLTTGIVRSESAPVQSTVNVSGVRTPTIQSASSSSETSPDEGQIQAPVPPTITRKQTLIRTQALEGTSPPPESFISQQPQSENQGSSLDVPGHSLTNGGQDGSTGQVPATSGSSGQQTQKKSGQSSQEAKEYLLTANKASNDSGHETVDTTDAGSDTSVLSRDSSVENPAANMYKDSSGVNIPRFIKETMLKSTKDKRTVLAYERQLIDFCRNESSQVLKMAEASSYDRMIAHRLSAFMGLEHNVDSSGKSVVINKTENMRLVKITDVIKVDDGEQDTKKKILLKKPASLDEKHSRCTGKGQFGSHKSKSLEERQQIYSEVRERIFKHGESLPETSGAPSLLSTNYTPQIQRSLGTSRPGPTSTTSTSPSSTSTSSSSSHHHHLHPARWASTDASSSTRYSQRAADLRASTMIKSNSYGGVGSDPASVPGLLGSEPIAVGGHSFENPVKEPSSLLYSSQASSHSAAPPPPLCPPSMAGPPTEQTTQDDRPTSVGGGIAQQQQQQAQGCPSTLYAYLVSSDYTSIPLGSLIIDPNTMQPHVNADGSLYRFDPSCPPPFMGQPMLQPSPPTTHLTYHMENLSMSDMAGKFATPAVDPSSGVTGQIVMSHPQATLTYPSSHPIQFSQAQLYPSMSPSPGAVPGQPPFQLVTYAPAGTPVTPTGQGHQILQAAPLEAQGQATVPMPTVGVPGLPHNLGGGTAYILGPAPYDIGGGGGVAMYTPYAPETMTAGGQHHQPHQLVQYNIAPAPAYGQPAQQQQLHQLQQQHQQQLHQLQQHQQQHLVSHTGAGQPAYFTAVQTGGPASTPTPPPPPPSHHPPGMALSQIPPPPAPQHVPPPTSSSSKTPSHLQYHHHHQQQQQQQHNQPTVFYSPGLGNLTMSPLGPGYPQPPSPLVMAPPSTSSAPPVTPLKSHGPGSQFIHYRSSPPPPLPPPQQQQHHHHQQQQHHQQHQPHMVAAGTAPSNGHHHHQQQVTLGKPVPLTPTNPAGPRPGLAPQQLVAYHPVRPVGTFMAVQPAVQPLVQPSPVGPTQLQPYQIFRQAAPDLRKVNPGSIRPRLTSLPFPNPNSQQALAKPSHRHQRKGPKRANSETKDADDSMRVPQTTLGPPQMGQVGQQHQQPLVMTPIIPGMMGHIPPAPSQR